MICTRTECPDFQKQYKCIIYCKDDFKKILESHKDETLTEHTIQKILSELK